MAPGKSLSATLQGNGWSEDEDGVRVMECNDFARLYEVQKMSPIQFCEEVELSNDRSDVRRVVVSCVSGEAAEIICPGDALIAIASRFVPAKTPAPELHRLIRQRGQSAATAFRLWRVSPPATHVEEASRAETSSVPGVETVVHCGRRKITGTRWGRIQLKIGCLDFVRYFVALRVGESDEHKRADVRVVRRGDVLVGIDHEPLPMLITSSDLQYRLSRGGTPNNPLTLNLFRVTDPACLKRILTSCDIVDAGGYYRDRQRAGGGPFSRCKCEGSSITSACMCMI